jgi:type IV secretion system protein VirB1
VLGECHARASAGVDAPAALRRALSCYYSGNFSTGVRHGYVGRVVAAAQTASIRTSPPRRMRTSTSQESSS